MTERLEEHLVARGLLSQERADDALRSQALVGGAMDTLLLEMGALREQDLVTALGEVSGLQPIYLADYIPNPAMASTLPREDAERLNIAPLSVEDEMLHVAVPYPVPMRGLEALVRKLGRSVAPWVSTDVRVRAWRSQIYGAPLPARDASLLGTLGPTLEERLATEMAEQAARAVAGEPVPLVNPRPEQEAPAARAPEVDTTAATEPAGSLLEALEAGVAAAEPEPPAWQPESPRARPQRRTREAAKDGAGDREQVVDWTLAEARSALRAVAGDREGLKDVVLRYARRTFDFAATFAVVRGTAMGWDARGEGADFISVPQVSFPLDVPSVFRTAALAHSCYAGPVPGDPLTRQVLDSLGRAPRSVFVFPVEVRGRLVAVLYGDRGERPVSQRRLSELILFCQDLGQAFAELIVLRKQRRFPEDDAPLESIAAMGLNGAPRRALESLDRAPPAPAPADLGPVLERLVGTDAGARAAAISELTRAPDAAARALGAQFPGPTAWSRVPVQELPAPDELGPVPAGLARLGAAGARALARFLDAPEADTRYVALLTAGTLPFPELVPGVLRGLFDPEPDVASAARAAATALRRLPRFQAALPDLRQELVAKEPERRVLAARALGVLHDRPSVEGLIGLTSSDDALSAQAAAEALIEITRASFGTSTRAWMAWWAENKGRRRVQWLLAALRNPEPWLRSVAAEELAGALGNTLGYSPDSPEPERTAAIARWEKALLDPRLRTVDA
ncbi:MAG TPA: FrgA protein [Myxococcaceae bacterium]|nr:FrgA protein [Myxococcaceae bacterium]